MTVILENGLGAGLEVWHTVQLKVEDFSRVRSYDRAGAGRSGQPLMPGQRLQWHLDIPLIVLEHKRLVGALRTEADRLAVDWHNLQADLAARSKYGKLVEVDSGHFMAGEKPEAIVEAIREVMR